MMRLVKLVAVVMALGATPAFAVNPDEVLSDPVLEFRAREISADLRCVVCRGENIDESNASIAKDLRLLVRERLLVGESDDEVVDFIVERYGEYVLMRPTIGGANIALWLAGPVLFLIAAITAIVYLRRRASAKDGGERLTFDEEARLKELLED